MKRIIFLALIILIHRSFVLTGQNTNIDSLQKLLSSYPHHDTFKVNLLNAIAYKLHFIDGKKSLKYAKDAQKLAERLNFSKGLAESNRIIGVYYKVRGNYSIALQYYMNSLKISEKSGDKLAIAKVLGNIGILYKVQNKIDNAFNYTRRALKINKSIKYQFGIGSNLTNLGLLYYKLKKYDDALRLQFEALEVYKTNNILLGLANSYINIGEVYFAKGDYSKSFDYYKKALTATKNIDYNYGYSASLLNIGAIYFKKHEYSKALNYTLQSMDVAKKYNFLDLKIIIYKQLSDIYAKTKRYKRAYENYVSYKVMNDSVFNIKSLSKISDLEYKYKYEQKKHEDELLQQKKEAERKLEAKRQKLIRNIFILGFIVMLAFGAVILYGFLQKKKANKILATQKKEIELKNSELHLQNEKIIEINAILDEQKEELKSLNHNLEEKVKNRTIELETALKKAEESKNLISAFLENMSHEIRTPMNAISGFAQLLANNNNEETKIENYTDIIVNNIDNLIEFIDNVMDASKLHADQYQFIESVFDLNNVFYNIYDKLVKKKKLKSDEVECRLHLPVGNKFLIYSDIKAFSYII
ncbi:MAG: tetratricopeptide repeat protein, partial [Bacteroidales bacterium]|nr:tetratricopeptide repeat protein [Bacteroidales bacterium]